jgi:hypothetical protein
MRNFGGQVEVYTYPIMILCELYAVIIPFLIHPYCC